MEMNDNTILRIKVPAHLYESVKAQLTLNEAKKANQYGAGMTPVGKKAAGASSDTPKAASERPKSPKGQRPKSPEGQSKANAPVRVHKGDSPGDNIPNADKDIPGRGLTEKKKLGLEELKAIVELLNGEIAQLEEKKEEKAPVEEEKEKMEESMERIGGQPKDASSLEGQMDRVWAAIDKIDAEIEALEPILKTPEVLNRLRQLNQRREKLNSQALDIRDAMEKRNKPTGKIHQMRRR